MAWLAIVAAGIFETGFAGLRCLSRRHRAPCVDGQLSPEFTLRSCRPGEALVVTAWMPPLIVLHMISTDSAGRLHVRLMGCGTDMEEAMDPTDAPALAGVHHLKLPVSDLARSRQWYRSRLGYEVTIEFVEQGKLMGYVLEHPNGGPPLGLRFDPDRARAAAGFDYFAIGVPDKVAIDRLAGQLSALGEDHDGVHFASIGWILPQLRDPDGHEIRFYTIEHHTELRAPGITTVDDPRESSERRERAWHTASASTDQA